MEGLKCVETLRREREDDVKHKRAIDILKPNMAAIPTKLTEKNNNKILEAR